jgi:hypothetical protein
MKIAAVVAGTEVNCNKAALVGELTRANNAATTNPNLITSPDPISFAIRVWIESIAPD